MFLTTGDPLQKSKKDIFSRADWQHAALEKKPDGSISCLNLAGKRDIQASKYIFCCGAGAESIISEKEFNFTAMQRRPLQMVMVRHNITAPVYVHCVSDKLTMTPEVTITTHRNGAGQPVWYLGGEIAEQGVQQSPGQLIDAARTKLQEIFPWCDFSEQNGQLCRWIVQNCGRRTAQDLMIPAFLQGTIF